MYLHQAEAWGMVDELMWKRCCFDLGRHRPPLHVCMHVCVYVCFLYAYMWTYKSVVDEDL